MICELILTYPHKDLNPNARKHWRAKSEAAKAYRRECFYAAKQAGWFGIEFTPRVHLWIDFYPPDKRARDDDNVFAAFKSGRDGIAEALGIDDKRFVSHPMLHPFDSNFQGVKVRISNSPSKTVHGIEIMEVT